MAEQSAGRSALAEVYRPDTFGARQEGGPGVTLRERRGLALVHFGGRAGDAACLGRARAALGIDLPLAPNTVARGEGLTVFWLGPARWLIESQTLASAALETRLRESVAGAGAVNDVSGGRTIVRIGGADARVLLAKGCPLDLHPTLFKPGRCAQSVLAGAAVLLHALPDGEGFFDLYVARSYAVHLWGWLVHHAADFGGMVVA